MLHDCSPARRGANQPGRAVAAAARAQQQSADAPTHPQKHQQQQRTAAQRSSSQAGRWLARKASTVSRRQEPHFAFCELLELTKIQTTSFSFLRRICHCGIPHLLKYDKSQYPFPLLLFIHGKLWQQRQEFLVQSSR